MNSFSIWLAWVLITNLAHSRPVLAVKNINIHECDLEVMLAYFSSVARVRMNMNGQIGSCRLLNISEDYDFVSCYLVWSSEEYSLLYIT